MNRLLQIMNTMTSLYTKQGVKYLENVASCPTFVEFKTCLDNLKLEDFNMSYDKSFLYDKDQPLKYMKVLNGEHCGMGIFFFPPGKGFPIHDHPNMFVATKILDGRLQSHSYTVLDIEKQTRFQNIVAEGNDKEPQNARELDSGLEVKDEGSIIINTGEAVYLTNKERNVHAVKALGNCAMLDVFIPNHNFRNFYSIISDQKTKAGEHILKLRMNAKGTTFDLTHLDYQDYKK